MESTATRNVNDIPAAERHLLETLLGRQLGADQQVFLLAYTPNVAPGTEVRAAARMRLQETFEAIDRNAQANRISPEEAQAAIDEAIDQVRRRTP